jgi:hypothetical protein
MIQRYYFFSFSGERENTDTRMSGRGSEGARIIKIPNENSPCRPISVRQLQIRSPFGSIFLGFIFLLTDRPCSRGYIFVNTGSIVMG